MYSRLPGRKIKALKVWHPETPALSQSRGFYALAGKLRRRLAKPRGKRKALYYL